MIAGLVEVKRNNIFGFTAFTTYGGFWLSLSMAHVLIGDDADVLFNTKAVQAMLVLMGVITFTLWLCTLRLNATISLLFFLLASTFFLLTAGWIGMATAATAYWLGAAELINDVIGKGQIIIPLGSFQSSISGATPNSSRTRCEGQALKGTKIHPSACVPEDLAIKDTMADMPPDIEAGIAAQ